MKPILFLAFLALGPAVADQLRFTPPGYADTVVVADDDAARVASSTGAISANTVAARERALLCGR